MFGDVLQQDTIAKGVDFDDSVTRTVENDTAHWLLGQVTSEEASSQALGKTQFRRTTRTYNGYGEVTGSVSGDPLDPDTQLTTGYARDDFGNVTLTAAYDDAGHYRSACTSYEPEGIFPYAAANQLGHTSRFAYDAGFGVLTGSVDPNGLVTRLAARRLRPPHRGAPPGRQLRHLRARAARRTAAPAATGGASGSRPRPAAAPSSRASSTAWAAPYTRGRTSRRRRAAAPPRASRCSGWSRRRRTTTSAASRA